MTIREQFEAGYLDIPGMGRHALAEVGTWSPTVRRIAANALRQTYDVCEYDDYGDCTTHTLHAEDSGANP